MKETRRFVCGDDLVYCVVNFEPLKPHHVLVIPRRHVQRLSELTPDEAHALNVLVDRLVDIISALHPNETPAIRVNHGRHKSQPHLHVHVLPSKGDLRDHISTFEGVPWRMRAEDDALTAMAEHLRAALADADIRREE